MAHRLSGRSYTVMAGRTVIHYPGMAEHRGHEGTAGHVADVAVLGRRHMIRLRVLAGGIGAVVAGVTALADHIGTTVVDKGVQETARVMAHGAVTTGIAVYRGIRFTYCTQRDMVRTAVMTGGAVIGDTAVRKYRWCEYIRCMAQFAVLRCWQVTGRLHQLGPVRNEAFVMTALTTAGDTRVHRREEGCRREHSRGVVANAAVIPCRDMINAFRRRYTGGVTGRAIVGVDARMVVGDTRKSGEVRGDVARRTIEARRNMTRMLAKRNVTVMAQLAIPGIDTRVVEYCTGERYGVMTVDAVLVIGIGGYVIVEFTDTDAVIVAAGAAADDAGMIIAARAESTRGMTDLAIVRADGHVCIERCAKRYTRRIDTVVTVVAALRQNRWIGVIDSKCRNEALGVVARATIRGCAQMNWRIRRRPGVNTGAAVVA